MSAVACTKCGALFAYQCRCFPAKWGSVQNCVNCLSKDHEISTLTARLAAAEAERDEARAAARILCDDLSQFTRTEWLLERWPWLKDEAEKMGGCDE